MHPRSRARPRCARSTHCTTEQQYNIVMKSTYIIHFRQGSEWSHLTIFNVDDTVPTWKDDLLLTLELNRPGAKPVVVAKAVPFFS